MRTGGAPGALVLVACWPVTANAQVQPKEPEPHRAGPGLRFPSSITAGVPDQSHAAHDFPSYESRTGRRMSHETTCWCEQMTEPGSGEQGSGPEAGSGPEVCTNTCSDASDAMCDDVDRDPSSLSAAKVLTARTAGRVWACHRLRASHRQCPLATLRRPRRPQRASRPRRRRFLGGGACRRTSLTTLSAG